MSQVVQDNTNVHGIAIQPNYCEARLAFASSTLPEYSMDQTPLECKLTGKASSTCHSCRLCSMTVRARPLVSFLGNAVVTSTGCQKVHSSCQCSLNCGISARCARQASTSPSPVDLCAARTAGKTQTPQTCRQRGKLWDDVNGLC
jgi:hypothetical protein